jgi:Secretion system C-terminal sorting domain
VVLADQTDLNDVQISAAKNKLIRPGVIAMLICVSFSTASAQADYSASVKGSASATLKTQTSSSDRNQIFKTGSPGDESLRVRIFPDPVTDYLLASVTLAEANTTVTVMSLIGTTMLTDVIPAGSSSIVLDVKNIPHGIYVIIFENKNDRQAMKFVKS